MHHWAATFKLKVKAGYLDSFKKETSPLLIIFTFVAEKKGANRQH